MDNRLITVGPRLGLVDSLDSPPRLVRLSRGGLLAQLVAARTRHAGVVAACPAPAAGKQLREALPAICDRG